MGTEMLPHLDMAMELNPARDIDIDPDVSATLSDFLTYTEHLPSSVVRSLTLIQSLNRKSDALQLHIHHLLTKYATLPSTTADAPDPVQLRKEISHAYDQLEHHKRMSAAEAVRLEDTVLKDGSKLQLVQKKLKALPMPPSRDPTPEPGLTSPQLRRNAQSQHAADKRVAQHRTGSAPRVRSRKIMVPGEVLPPPNPDSPPPSDFSASPSPPPQSPAKDRTKTLGRPPKTPKLPKPQKEPKDRVQKTPRVRPPGVTGTNAHSAVAGISTSNALMALTAPPPDAQPGSRWLPWKRLTEYEMATLRKRMKKNAIWLPSPAMRNRELKNLGRGVAAMEEARAAAEASGQPFLDETDSTPWLDPTRVHLTDAQQEETEAILGPEQTDANDDDAALINRGMRLNEAKKLKREKQRMEEEAQRQLESQLQPPQDQSNKEKKSPQKAQQQPQPQTQPQEQPQAKSPAKSQTKPQAKAQTKTQAQSQAETQAAPQAQSESDKDTEAPARPEASMQQPEEAQLPPDPQLQPLPEPKSKPLPEPKSKPEPKPKKQARSKPEPEAEATQPEKVPEATQPKKVSGAKAAAEPEPAIQAPVPEEAKKAEAEPAAPVEPPTTRKRKRDATTPAPAAPPPVPVAESPDVLSLPHPAPQPKKIKLSVPAPVLAPPHPEKPAISVSTRSVAAANGKSSPSTASTPVLPSPRMSTRQRSQRNSVQPEPPAPAPAAQPPAQTPAANTRAAKSGPTITLKHSSTKAASAEPPIRRMSLRRNSNVSLPDKANKMRSPAPNNAAGSSDAKPEKRRTRVKAPQGILATEEDSSKVIVAKPKAASKKKKAQQNKEAKEEVAATAIATEDEMIDPDEPRYCLCNDVSHGTMIACDNENCEKEWYHLDCVRLADLPGRRTKWYCPECRKKLKLGLTTNGVVR